jgi:hypothetical protein
MIEPTEDDIGRAVVYTGNRFPGGKLEEGIHHVVQPLHSFCPLRLRKEQQRDVARRS